METGKWQDKPFMLKKKSLTSFFSVNSAGNQQINGWDPPTWRMIRVEAYLED